MARHLAIGAGRTQGGRRAGSGPLGLEALAPGGGAELPRRQPRAGAELLAEAAGRLPAAAPGDFSEGEVAVQEEGARLTDAQLQQVGHRRGPRGPPEAAAETPRRKAGAPGQGPQAVALGEVLLQEELAVEDELLNPGTLKRINGLAALGRDPDVRGAEGAVRLSVPQ